MFITTQIVLKILQNKFIDGINPKYLKEFRFLPILE